MAGRLGSERYWHSAARIQWVTALGLMPIVLLFFQQASLIAPIANFIAVPLISLTVVPASLTGVLLLTVLPAAGRLVLAAVEWVLESLCRFLTVLSDLPFAQWTHPLVPLWVLPFACIGVLLLLSPRGIPGRWLGLVLLTPLIFVAVPRPDDGGDVRLTLLDVGQGLSTVVQTAHHVLVFDSGARYSDRFDLGSAVIEPFLRAQAEDKIDVLVISHGDNDHIGGAEALLRLFDVGQVLTSVPERMTYARATFCRSGQAWTWDGIRFRILSPNQTPLPDGNDNSCVLQIIAPGGSILLTGDIEQAAEQRLLQQYGEALASDVLVVPHHGSNTSSTAAFLKAVKPRYALVPAGYRNRYGFPARSVMRRLDRLQSRMLNTALSEAKGLKSMHKKVFYDRKPIAGNTANIITAEQ
jgi:competence protein ComEC